MKRRTVYGLGLGLGALLRIPAALRLSPWPGALLIRQLFNHGDAQTLARLARHVPAGLRQQRDLAYGPDPDERLDLYLPAAARHPLPTLVWVHGGGWVAGSRLAVSHWLQIVANAGHACVPVGHSTSRSDARYPTPLRQVNQALGWLHEHANSLGLDAGRVVLGGSSAWAQISAQLALPGSSQGYARRVGIVPDPLLTRLHGRCRLCCNLGHTPAPASTPLSSRNPGNHPCFKSIAPHPIATLRMCCGTSSSSWIATPFAQPIQWPGQSASGTEKRPCRSPGTVSHSTPALRTHPG